VLEIYNHLPVKQQDRDAVDKELKKYGIDKNDRLLMIHPTFSGYSRFGIRKRHAKLRKLWSPDNYGELVKKIVSTQQNDASPIKAFMVLLPDEISYGRKNCR